MAAIRALRLRPAFALRWVVAMRRLLEQLELCGGPDGSQARQEVLAERLGISDRQFRRWLALAVDEGLVEVTDRWTTNGRRRRTAILWERVLAGPADVRETQLFFEFDRVRDGHDDRSHQDVMAGCNREDSGSSEVISSPTPPAPAGDSVGGDELRLRGEEWQELRDLLRDRGVVGVPQLLDGIRSRGVEPWAVSAVVRFWDANRSAWRSPGALHWRLRNLVAGAVPESDWRSRWDETLREWPPATVVRRPSSDASRRPQTRSDVPASRSSVELVNVPQVRDERRRQYQATAARLERDYGPGWDDLSAADQAALVEQLGGRWLLDRWRKAALGDRAKRAAMRVEVLGLIDQRRVGGCVMA